MQTLKNYRTRHSHPLGYFHIRCSYERFRAAKNHRKERKNVESRLDLFRFSLCLHFMINSIRPFRCCSIMFVNTYFYVSALLFTRESEIGAEKICKMITKNNKFHLHRFRADISFISLGWDETQVRPMNLLNTMKWYFNFMIISSFIILVILKYNWQHCVCSLHYKYFFSSLMEIDTLINSSSRHRWSFFGILRRL